MLRNGSRAGAQRLVDDRATPSSGRLGERDAEVVEDGIELVSIHRGHPRS